MKVYNYSENGVYTGYDVAQESPMEPGKYLIPRNSTTVEPPAFGPDQQAFWNGSSWEIQNKPQPTPTLDNTPLPPSDKNPLGIHIPEPYTWETIRGIRDVLLSQTDWVFSTDSPILDKQPWLNYRQALRDVPQSFPNPDSVVWPSKP